MQGGTPPAAITAESLRARVVFKGMMVAIFAAGDTPQTPGQLPPPLFEVVSVNAGNIKIMLTVVRMAAHRPAAATTTSPSAAASGPPLPPAGRHLFAYDPAVDTANTGGKSSISSHAAQQMIIAGDSSSWDLALLLPALLNSAHVQLVAPADGGLLAGTLADLRKLRNVAMHPSGRVQRGPHTSARADVNHGCRLCALFEAVIIGATRRPSLISDATWSVFVPSKT
jgi:hypothetical protein